MFIGTSGTPSPTFRLSGYRSLSERQRLSGRQHLVTSACSARTPSPTICLSECRGLSGRRGRRPLHFRRKDTVPCRNKNIGSGRQNYRDVEDAVPYISLIGIPKFIGTSTFIGTSAPHYLGVLRKDAVPHNFVALTEQIPYSGIITFRFISLSDI